MTKFAKAVLPPFLQEIVSALRNHGTLRFLGKIFTGVFRTFDDVSRAFPETVAYNSADSEREEVARAAQIRAMILDARRGIAPAAVERYTLLAALVAASSSPNVTVLDIGGGMGDALPHLIYSCPEKKIRLIVSELSAIAAAGQKAFHGDESVHFVSDIAAAKEPIQIVFMGSSLQYFEDYSSFVKQIAALRPHLVVVAHTPMTDAPTFVTAQVNMRQRIMPNKIINRAELAALFDGLGYALIARSESPTLAHFRNFPTPQNASSFSNMIFASRAHQPA